MKNKYKTAYFAGGCFWCIEGIMKAQEGVIESISGFSGGEEKNPSYTEVCRGLTSHKEAVKVVYDPEAIDYINLVSVFWRQIDPIDNEGQFADRGDHYRTAIFYTDEYQKEIAEASLDYLEKSEQFDDSIATEVLPFMSFYPAEAYHQDYSNKEACHYTMYKKGSGRAGYIDDTWGVEDSSLVSEEDYNRITEKYNI